MHVAGLPTPECGLTVNVNCSTLFNSPSAEQVTGKSLSRCSTKTEQIYSVVFK